MGVFPGVKVLLGDTQLRADLPGRLAAIQPQSDRFPFEGGVKFPPWFGLRHLICFSFFHCTNFPSFSLNWCPSNRSNLILFKSIFLCDLCRSSCTHARFMRGYARLSAV